MEKKGSKKKEECGVVLIVSLLITTAILILVVPFLFKLSAQYRNSSRTFDSLAAINLAEAGIERAIWELNHGDISSWTGDNDLRTMTISSIQAAGGTSVGDIELSVTNPDGVTPVVEATGKVPFSGDQTVDKTIRVVLERSGTSVFDYAAFGNSRISTYDGSLIDSFDSRDGLYGGENVRYQGHIGTNGIADNSIMLISMAEVYGNAYSGVGSDPELAIGVDPIAYLDGSKLNLSEPKELLPATPPEGLPSRGDYRLETGQDTISESGEYTSFDLDSGTKVTIMADVIINVGDFNMDALSELEIIEGVSLTIYITADLMK